MRKMKSVDEIGIELKKSVGDLLDDQKGFLDDETIEIYLFIKQRYKTSENLMMVYVFRSLFSSYYFMQYLSKDEKKNFFNLFDKLKGNPNINLNQVIELNKKMLSENKFQFSFTTKMLNLINHEYPIYDYNVDNVLKIGYYSKINTKKGKKYEIALKVYEELNKFCNDAKSDVNIICSVEAFDRKFSQYKASLSWTKKLDFLLWALYKWQIQPKGQ